MARQKVQFEPDEIIFTPEEEERKVRIGPYDYTVKEVESFNDGIYGESCEQNLTIYLRTGMDEQHKLPTLVHEIFHAVSSISGIDLEENQIQGLANLWTQVLQDNDLYGLIK